MQSRTCFSVYSPACATVAVLRPPTWRKHLINGSVMRARTSLAQPHSHTRDYDALRHAHLFTRSRAATTQRKYNAHALNHCADTLGLLCRLRLTNPHLDLLKPEPRRSHSPAPNIHSLLRRTPPNSIAGIHRTPAYKAKQQPCVAAPFRRGLANLR